MILVLKKDFQGIFALINNKKEKGYIELFKSISNIITLTEGNKNLKLKSITIDFEERLINSLNHVFPETKKIGCFFHYTRALREKAKNLGLLKKDRINTTKKMLKDFYKLPSIYDSK